MPIKRHFRRERNLLILEHIGTVSDEEFLAFYKSLYGDDRFVVSMDQLVDLRRADSTPRSPEVLRQFAQFVMDQYPIAASPVNIAVVAPKDLSYGLARMYDAFSQRIPWIFEIFRDLDAAADWLGLPRDFVETLRMDDPPATS